jgi:alpha-ketoglutarate-dependent taurine dioxygenase
MQHHQLGVSCVHRLEIQPPACKLAEYLKGAFNWHLDDTTSDVPSRATMLTGRRLSPDGGGTEFASTYAAYANLPAHERKRYQGLRVVHSFEAAQRKVNPDPTEEELASWRTAPTHESALVWKRRDGRNSLVIGATADHIVGLPADESRALLDELLTWTTQSRFSFTHDWTIVDAVLWDNTAVLHRALPYDPSSGRMLRRTHIKGQEAWL